MEVIDMPKIFFTGDLHFGHANAIKSDDRPFSSVEEMDEELIRRWNNKVGKGDITYVLGDMIWKPRNDDAASIIKRLNGQIILIKGNHDKFLHNSAVKKLFAAIKEGDNIKVTLEDGSIKQCILNHHFIPLYDRHKYGAIMLHAHSHTSEEAAIEREIADMLNERGFRNEIYNVGCMYWNYEPVTLDEILATSRAGKELCDVVGKSS